LIPKKIQTGGSSAVYHRAVAYFVKRDKAILLPVGSILCSPSGVLFSVASSRFVDAYETILTGFPVTYIFPLLENVYLTESSVFNGVMGMQCGLPWPRIGWDVLSFTQSIRCPAPVSHTYVGEVIPPPYRAYVHRDQDLSSMLFSCPRRFVEPGSSDGRMLMTDEYHRTVVQAQIVLAMKGFCTYLCDLQHWREELALIDEEDGNLDRTPCFPGACHIPTDVSCKDAFVQVMQSCSKEVMNALTFQRDIVRHLHPRARIPDKYHCFPLIPRDETSNEGMLMTVLGIHFSLGLLERMPSGNIKRGMNVGKRKVFMYGDAMTVVNWKRTYDIIFNKYAVYVPTFKEERGGGGDE
jgi:hypothetical protein